VRALFDEQKLVAVVRHSETKAAEEIAEGCIEAGWRAIEITWTVPGAAAVVRQLVKRGGAGLLIGAGTILDERQLDEALQAGAAFVVTPGTVPPVLDRCVDGGIPVLPGVLTPTEALTVRARGVTTVKLFPASTVGTGHLSALKSVVPDLDIVPTGGVDERNAHCWLAAGAAAVGIGSSLNRAYAAGGRAAVAAMATALLHQLGGANP